MESELQKEQSVSKRRAGQIILDGKMWLVLSESVQNPEGNWTHSCGSVILGKTVIHTIWDGVSLCSGGGETVSEQIPYCDSCEEAPGSTGVPIIKTGI